eukprot:CAMPEP_0197839386 /NCGR_PEP_ID=MMETSP1437-20131217/42474_1 /TAXON_ID=49252 ORGANISM="Eucampia antarctica, Strain CCMP1452" /NCGR_SAMPLE_ID=MMETSP1437 /ASSEMBLY_ACC=CAM_ASM_001096 /LENGTH=253 /DNA_ID=CAMNT_0043448373 /DNA_START=27 /DNA_END=784 /DNA_ORIENTATION=-
MASSSQYALPKDEERRFDRAGILLALKADKVKKTKTNKSIRMIASVSRKITVPFRAVSSRLLDSSTISDDDKKGKKSSGIMRGIFGPSLSVNGFGKGHKKHLKTRESDPNTLVSPILRRESIRRRGSTSSIESTHKNRRINLNTAQLTLGIEEESAAYLDLVGKMRVQDWMSSFRRMDPRYQIMSFFDDVAQEGCGNLRVSGQFNPNMVSPILRAFKRSSIFSVWRPTSKESIKKMILGHGTGKGLDIKGKSA